MKKTMQRGRTDVRKLTYLSLLTAIVVIFQLIGAFIKIGPVSASLVLVPISIGAALLGPMAGAWLGLVFGIVVLCQPDTQIFFVASILGTVITCLLKGALAGFISGLMFKLTKKLNTYAAAVISAFVCPIVNTGIFLLGCLVFFLDTVSEWAAAATGSPSVGLYMIVGLVGWNFVFELALNLILVPVVHRVLKLGGSRKIERPFV